MELQFLYSFILYHFIYNKLIMFMGLKILYDISVLYTTVVTDNANIL